MPKKQLFSYLLLFLASFFIFLLLLFPYEKMAGYLIGKLSQSYSIKITYSSLSSNPTSTEIKGLTIDAAKPIKIPDLTIRYSPLIVITRTIRIEAKGVGSAIVTMSSNTLKSKGEVNLGYLKTLFSQITGGTAKFNLELNTKKLTGTLRIQLSNVKLETKLGKYSIERVNALAAIDRNIIKIKRFVSNGGIKLSLMGNIVLDLNKLEYSRLYITGHINLKGIKQSFRITGTVAMPVIS